MTKSMKSIKYNLSKKMKSKAPRPSLFPIVMAKLWNRWKTSKWRKTRKKKVSYVWRQIVFYLTKYIIRELKNKTKNQLILMITQLLCVRQDKDHVKKLSQRLILMQKTRRTKTMTRLSWRLTSVRERPSRILLKIGIKL